MNSVCVFLDLVQRSLWHICNRIFFSRSAVFFLWTDLTVKVALPSKWRTLNLHRVPAETQNRFHFSRAVTPFIYSELFIRRDDAGVSARSLQRCSGARSLFCLPPKDSADKRAADLFISFAARDTDREDVSPVNKAQPTHRALVSLGLFGRSGEVLPHPTFLLKCCQHHMSARQID